MGLYSSWLLINNKITLEWMYARILPNATSGIVTYPKALTTKFFNGQITHQGGGTYFYTIESTGLTSLVQKSSNSWQDGLLQWIFIIGF